MRRDSIETMVVDKRRWYADVTLTFNSGEVEVLRFSAIDASGAGGDGLCLFEGVEEIAELDW